MDFHVTILGSNSAAPAHDRNQTSQIVTIGRVSVLVDCGEGTQIQFRKFGVKTSRIEYILISHLHGDHYLGLMGILSTFHLNKRTKPLTVFGPKGLDEIITVQLKYGNIKLNYPLNFVLINPKEKTKLIDHKFFEVYSFPTKHRVPCTGFFFAEKPKPRNLRKEMLFKHKLNLEAINNLKAGRDVFDEESGELLYSLEDFTYPPAHTRSYAYSADTIYDPDLIPNFESVDLLYHESTFMESEKERAHETFHSTASQAASIAKQANAKKLLLGHYSVRYKELDGLLMEAQEVFPNTELSIEGKTHILEEWKPY
ncbi:ribonuclease Z [Litoribacter alkaliphilus]|uniref:Ribonuclease Z n=1 Tax=Litoribacter ruber TaxID=702568 RepID=A0AAP2CIG4_9BACT|nr:ribonuclease Z [Litoribacter alkaliphilus]MBS9523170.1 ribonuclease Z [Litoribacter alkaliphilus]